MRISKNDGEWPSGKAMGSGPMIGGSNPSSPATVARERRGQPPLWFATLHDYRKKSMYYFYILQSQKNITWFYKGSTPDLKQRIIRHNKGEVESTKSYYPFHLVYYEAYLTKEAAIKREMSVKNSGSVWKPLMKRIHESLE